MQTFSTTAALVALLGMVNGHMIMNTPTPYNCQGTGKLVQVDPLGENFPFPCQGNSEIVSVTSITAGTSQLVKFTGGGSCQFSVTYDFPPPADPSKWKTIYTLIGGCPVSAAGNLPAAQPDGDGRADSPQCNNDFSTECIRQFDVPIPKDLPNGNATFAWTWYNKIGNRELYMNCAPVSITGGSDKQAFFSELPEMFVANIPGKCTTGNGVLNIPNPGKFGKVLEQPAADSEGSCPTAAGVPTFDGAVSDGSDTPVISSSTLATIIAPTSSSAPVETASLVVNPIEATTTSSETGRPTLVVNPIEDAAGEPCSPNDSFFCFDDDIFGHCSNGRAVRQAMAPGVICNFGTNVVKRQRRFGAKLFA